MTFQVLASVKISALFTRSLSILTLFLPICASATLIDVRWEWYLSAGDRRADAVESKDAFLLTQLGQLMDELHSNRRLSSTSHTERWLRSSNGFRFGGWNRRGVEQSSFLIGSAAAVSERSLTPWARAFAPTRSFPGAGSWFERGFRSYGEERFGTAESYWLPGGLGLDGPGESVYRAMLEQFARSRTLLLALAKEQFAGVAAFRNSADTAAGGLIVGAVASEVDLAALTEEKVDGSGSQTTPLVAVPEPSIPPLMLVGIAALAYLRRNAALTSH